MHNFQNELQGLAMDPYQAGQLVQMGPQIQDTRIWGRCGGCGFRCGGCGFGCGGFGFGCGGFGFGCGGFGFGGCFGCFGIGFGFI